ncbi:MAG: hypothetical protein ACRD1E_03310 [Terriglobales bacterium]
MSEDHKPSALCLSGGGIRSATFCLGVLQGLAEKGVLGTFDLLSTVSGGGYIGGWLTAWIHRQGLPAVEAALRPGAPAAVPDPIEHLRAYNSYLSPRRGAFSADTWTLAATVTRNVVLNWLVFIPLLLAALLLPRLAFALAQLWWGPAVVLPGLAAALYADSLWHMVRYLPSLGGVNACRSAFARGVLLPLVLAAFLVSVYQPGQPSIWLCLAAAAGAGVPALFQRALRARWRLLVFALLLFAAGTGSSVWLLESQLVPALAWPYFVTLAVPFLLLGFCLTGSLFTGFASHPLRTLDREWMARAGAEILRAALLWSASFALVLLAPSGLISLTSWGIAAAAGVAGVSGWLNAWAGFRGFAASLASSQKTAGRRSWQLQAVAAVFLALLAAGLALATAALLASTGAVAAPWTDPFAVLIATPWWLALALAAGFFALALVMSRFININKFSLAGMYRDRLIRAYLGASNLETQTDCFTGLSLSDDIALHEISPAQRPRHVINCTLNLVNGERLAWQQRMAELFTASPESCGTPGLGYRPTAEYGGKGGITLGTAVAISGAAASPEMGYHSSPLAGFIMTLFNVRLGAWLGNPGRAGDKTWKLAGPRSAAGWMLREALGRTDDRSPYVYLTDGGHFENLGLYAMVQRGCRLILAVDSGCDPGFSFEDLGNALRKIRIDLGVSITFAPGHEVETMLARKQRCAVATIAYSQRDPGAAPALEDGVLIYLKPMFLADEVPDVASYHAAHPDFPHHSPADQWFDESQTESYRMLGLASLESAWQIPGLADLFHPPRAARA